MLIGPISFRGRCGYLDEVGQVRIPFSFEELGIFSEGVAWFVKDGKVGFVSEHNEIVIPPIFDRGDRPIVTSDFHSGLAPVRLGGQEGYINHAGVFQIPSMYRLCGRFVGEIALVCEKGHVFSVIDRSGVTISQLPFADVAEAPYEPDIIKVYSQVNGEGAPAFVNRFGKVVAGPFPDMEEVYSFSVMAPFYAVARSRSNRLVGFLNRQWNCVLPFIFSNANDFSEEMSAASTQDYRWGFIDPDGNWVITPDYTDAHGFHNGTASVRKGRGKDERWLVIDKQNHQISPGYYDRVVDLNNGIRCVWCGRSLMVIDSDCRVVWSAEE